MQGGVIISPMNELICRACDMRRYEFLTSMFSVYLGDIYTRRLVLKLGNFVGWAYEG